MYWTDMDKDLAERRYKDEFYISEDRGGYEWSIAQIYSHIPKGCRKPRVYYIAQSGCSCYGFGDNIDSADEAIGEMVALPTLAAAMDLTKQYVPVTNHKYDEFIEKFRTLGLR